MRYHKIMGFIISREMWLLLKEISKKHNVSMSRYVRIVILENFLENKEKFTQEEIYQFERSLDHERKNYKG